MILIKTVFFHQTMQSSETVVVGNYGWTKVVAKQHTQNNQRCRLVV